MLRVRYLFLLCILSIVVSCQSGGGLLGFGDAPHSFVEPYPGYHHGPEEADGAIIWLHGWCPGTEDCSQAQTPPHIRAFGSNGWDVYRLNIPPSSANQDSVGWRARTHLYANLAYPHISELRSQGYRRIAVAGYSGGAISALYLGTMTPDIDAVIAVAPCCGVNPSGPYIDIFGFYGILDDFEAHRVMIFFFSGERNAPANIGQRSHDILVENGVDFIIHDRPGGHVGHGAGLSRQFANEFSEEMIRFALGE